VTITDLALNPVAVFGFPYHDIPYGNAPEWVELELPTEVRPPAKFAVAIYAHCLQDCGLFMSLDTSQRESKSYSTLPGADEARQPDVEGQPANWMIRCQMAAEYQAAEDLPVLLSYDTGKPTEIQSMGGRAQAVTFTTPDDGVYTVERVYVCASYYGMPGQDGASNQIALYIANNGELAQKTYR